MNEIFLITGYNSSDFEAFPTPIGFVETEDLAKEMVKHLSEIQQIVKSIRTQIYDYQKNIIIPSIPKIEFETIPNYPKWESGMGKNITEEMRCERDTIKQQQKDINGRNEVRYKMWTNLVDTLKNEYILSLNLDPEVLLGLNSSDYINNFDYEKIEKL